MYPKSLAGRHGTAELPPQFDVASVMTGIRTHALLIKHQSLNPVVLTARPRHATIDLKSDPNIFTYKRYNKLITCFIILLQQVVIHVLQRVLLVTTEVHVFPIMVCPVYVLMAGQDLSVKHVSSFIIL